MRVSSILILSFLLISIKGINILKYFGLRRKSISTEIEEPGMKVQGINADCDIEDFDGDFEMLIQYHVLKFDKPCLGQIMMQYRFTVPLVRDMTKFFPGQYDDLVFQQHVLPEIKIKDDADDAQAKIVKNQINVLNQDLIFDEQYKIQLIRAIVHPQRYQGLQFVQLPILLGAVLIHKYHLISFIRKIIYIKNIKEIQFMFDHQKNLQLWNAMMNYFFVFNYCIDTRFDSKFAALDWLPRIKMDTYSLAAYQGAIVDLDVSICDYVFFFKFYQQECISQQHRRQLMQNLLDQYSLAPAFFFRGLGIAFAQKDDSFEFDDCFQSLISSKNDQLFGAYSSFMFQGLLQFYYEHLINKVGISSKEFKKIQEMTEFLGIGFEKFQQDYQELEPQLGNFRFYLTFFGAYLKANMESLDNVETRKVTKQAIKTIFGIIWLKYKNIKEDKDLVEFQKFTNLLSAFFRSLYGFNSHSVDIGMALVSHRSSSTVRIQAPPVVQYLLNSIEECIDSKKWLYSTITAFSLGDFYSLYEEVLSIIQRKFAYKIKRQKKSLVAYGFLKTYEIKKESDVIIFDDFGKENKSIHAALLQKIISRLGPLYSDIFQFYFSHCSIDVIRIVDIKPILKFRYIHGKKTELLIPQKLAFFDSRRINISKILLKEYGRLYLKSLTMFL